nr:hypothetical protein [Methylobacterium durans]
MLPLQVTRLAPGPDRPRAAQPARDGVAGRALFAARRAQKAPDAIRFMIRGSTGNRYEVELEERPFGFYLRCSCMAGRNRRRCRHVDAMVDGDVTDLISANVADVERLRLLIEGAPTGHRIEPKRVGRVQAA